METYAEREREEYEQNEEEMTRNAERRTV